MKSKEEKAIEFQLEKIGFSVEKQFDDNLKVDIIESFSSLNWAIIKYLNR